MMGLEVIAHLREHIFNRNRAGRRATKIKEPKFVICSSFMTPQLRSHLAEQQVLGFEKPMQTDQLNRLIQQAI
jgi:hypothetical protein